MIVRVTDLRLVEGFSANPGLCHRGARGWFAERGWDWAAFVRDGIPAQTLRDTGDAFALALVAAVEARDGR